jgi:polar amino acid transport system substrate-binding protein
MKRAIARMTGPNAKMRLRLALLLTAIFLPAANAIASTANAPACQRVILTGDPDYPPFSWHENSEFKGSAIEIAALALKRIRLPYEIRYVGPFQKVLDSAKAGTVDLIAELKNTPERRAYLSYSEVPIFANPVAIFTRADRKTVYNTWDDLIGLRGGITIDNKFGGGLDEFVASRLTIETGSRISQNFSKLANGQIDYFINSYYPALSYLIRERKEHEFKLLQPFATTSDNFVGWSKASPCLGKLAEFDVALAAMVRSGEVRRILEANLDRMRKERRRPEQTK